MQAYLAQIEDPLAREISIRYTDDAKKSMQGTDAEILLCLRFLEGSSWVEAYDPAAPVLDEAGYQVGNALAVIAHAAWTPTSALSPEVRERCIAVCLTVGEMPPPEFRAYAAAALRSLVGRSVDAQDIPSRYADPIERWTADEEANRYYQGFIKTLSKRFARHAQSPR